MDSNPPVANDEPDVPDDGLNDEEHEAVAALAPELDELQRRLLLSNAQLRVVLEALVEDIDLDEELAHVSGLTVVDGKVEGTARYRPPRAKATERARPQAPRTRARREVKPAASEDDIRARLVRLGFLRGEA